MAFATGACGLILLTLVSAAPGLAFAAEIYVSPQGSGSRDGSTIENSASAAGNGLQRCWDRMRPGDTLVMTSGTYPGAALAISDGGMPGHRKTLCGRDTGGGLPVVTSDFDRSHPENTGAIFVESLQGASHWEVRQITVRNYNLAVRVGRTASTDLVIADLQIEGVREGVRIENADHVQVQSCTVSGYTKRGVRLKNAGPHTVVSGCLADAGGRPWATEPFQMGFGLESTSYSVVAADELGACVTFDRCVARNNFHDAGEKYWNADGFCAETGVSQVRYTSCLSTDNTDGGWDDKSERTFLEGCVALRNKRNFRFWGPDARLTRCLAAFSRHPGGSGGPLEIWSAGRVVAVSSTLYSTHDPIELDKGGRVELRRCIVAVPKPLQLLPGARLLESKVWILDQNVNDPKFPAPREDWNGVGDAFDSQTFQGEYGYSSQPDSMK